MTLAAIAFLTLARPSLAATPALEICQPRDDKSDAASVDGYFMANLKEHEQYGFSRPLSASARRQAKSFLDQRIADKRAEICAARLKLVEDIKATPAKFASGDCAAAAVVGLFERYMTAVAGTFDENRQMLGAMRDAHIRDLKLKLFDIAKGSTAGAEGGTGTFPPASASKEARYEWLKQEATKLGGEAQVVWGAADPARNPLLQLNLVIAREAMHAKQERDAAKVHFHTDGKISPTCKPKSL